jgi:hypothetical protein
VTDIEKLPKRASNIFVSIKTSLALSFLFFLFFRFLHPINMDDLIPVFMKIGLSEQKAKDTAKNKKLAPTLESVIDEANVRDSGCNKDVGNLLYNLASTITKEAQPHRTFIVKKITNGDLKTTDQVGGKYIAGVLKDKIF